MDQHVEFIFGENNNYHQIGNSYLEIDITIRNPAAVFDDNSDIRLSNNGLAYVFTETRLSTTSGSDLEHNKFVGQVSLMKRVLTSKNGDLLSQFDKINESAGVDETATTDIIRKTSLKKLLFDNQETDANKGKIKAQLPLEHIIGFCELFKKITKNLAFHLSFKTANLQDIVYTTLANAVQVNVTINSLYLNVPFLISNTET